MSLASIVSPDRAFVASDVGYGLRFPSPEMVTLAAALYDRLGSWRGDEGPRSQLVIGPGVVQVTRRDPARRERRLNRDADARRGRTDLAATPMAGWADIERALSYGWTPVSAGRPSSSMGPATGWAAVQEMGDWLDADEQRDGKPAARVVRCWSRKSRANMRKVLAQLDYGPIVSAGRPPAMVTLTYPGDWLVVAPDAKTCKRHVDELKRRYRRVFGAPMVGIWKREFQRRGAPHYHLWMVPPEPVNGETFRDWLGETWADVVGHPDAEERRRHRLAGVGVDYAEGLRARDPRRLAEYFAKHGLYSAKDYQNQAPDEWTGSVGRFWGVWGLDKATATVEITPDRALAAARTLRRYYRSKGVVVPCSKWRKKATVDRETGEIGWRWVRRKSTRRVVLVRGDLGYLVVNDGPAFASQLARYLQQI